jgi:hypothetical protein
MSGLCVLLSKVYIEEKSCADLDCVDNCDTGVEVNWTYSSPIYI